MNQRKLRRITRVAAALGAGLVLGALSCVQQGTDLVGTGLSVTGATGILGANSQAASNIGAGLDLVADLMRIAPLGG